MFIYKPTQDPFPGKGPISISSEGFYTRLETLTLIQDSLRAGESVSLVGERKAGKTSFLNYLVVNLPPDEFIPVHIDAQRIAPKTDKMFLGWLARQAAQAIATYLDIDAVVSQSISPTSQHLGQLLQLVDFHFDEEELRELCFYLGIDYDNLPALGKINKVRELILHLLRRGRLSVLIQTAKDLRPQGQWEALPEIPSKTVLDDSWQINTIHASPEAVYMTFEDDLERLRTKLPVNSKGRKVRLVWLIDEIEILRGYEQTNLFTFLRPFAQSDPDFRMVVAGYDVLYTLATMSDWSPFYSAFRSVPLQGLNPNVAKELINDAVSVMEATVDDSLYEQILTWTGQKPFFLKWILSSTTKALNQRQSDYNIDTEVLDTAQRLFLQEPDLVQYFAHLWQTHTTPSQQKILSLIASQTGPYTQVSILEQLEAKELLDSTQLVLQHLIDDLTRLKQLGFLYELVGNYTFTSNCLKIWIAQNKPL